MQNLRKPLTSYQQEIVGDYFFDASYITRRQPECFELNWWSDVLSTVRYVYCFPGSPNEMNLDGENWISNLF